MDSGFWTRSGEDVLARRVHVVVVTRVLLNHRDQLALDPAHDETARAMDDQDCILLLSAHWFPA
jgi:hypothetical protein